MIAIHTHNFYIQLAGETGLIGLVAGCFMMGSILMTCFSYRHVDKENIFTAIAYVIPLAVFFLFKLHRISLDSGIMCLCGLPLRLLLRLAIFCLIEDVKRKRNGAVGGI